MAFYGTGMYSGPIVSAILPRSSSIPVHAQLFTKVFEAGIPYFVGFFG